MAGKRSKKQVGRRRCAKTGRFLSASAPRTPRTLRAANLCSSLLLDKELFQDFLLFVDADSALVLCKAMVDCCLTRSVLYDRGWWRQLLQSHCLADLAALKVHRSVVLDEGCNELMDYLSLRSQLERFERLVKVVKGDLGDIVTVGEQRVDCLVFPTSNTYRNPSRGVSGRVHERAGPTLDQTVQNVRMRTAARPGSVLCTVGCDSGVRLLVHCVGPSGVQPDGAARLYQTYANSLLAADSNHVECAAVASISTGMLRFPVAQAANIAMSVIRDLVRLYPHWAVNVAFVCIDEEVYRQFQRARHETLHTFDTAAFPYPRVLSDLTAAEHQAADAA